jgi:predicted phosphohydrolase
VAGNHDFAFEREADKVESLIPEGVTYLRDSVVVINGVRFWGSPWQP